MIIYRLEAFTSSVVWVIVGNELFLFAVCFESCRDLCLFDLVAVG